MVTTPDGRSGFVVWIVGAEGTNRLVGFDGETGATLYAGGGAAQALTQVRRFSTPIAAVGRTYVAGHGRLCARAMSDAHRNRHASSASQ